MGKTQKELKIEQAKEAIVIADIDVITGLESEYSSLIKKVDEIPSTKFDPEIQKSLSDLECVFRLVRSDEVDLSKAKIELESLLIKDWFDYPKINKAIAKVREVKSKTRRIFTGPCAEELVKLEFRLDSMIKELDNTRFDREFRNNYTHPVTSSRTKSKEKPLTLRGIVSGCIYGVVIFEILAAIFIYFY